MKNFYRFLVTFSWICSFELYMSSFAYLECHWFRSAKLVHGYFTLVVSSAITLDISSCKSKKRAARLPLIYFKHIGVLASITVNHFLLLMSVYNKINSKRFIMISVCVSNSYSTFIIIMPQCACACMQARYTVVCLCVCVCVCVCRLLQLLKDQWSSGKSFYIGF